MKQAKFLCVHILQALSGSSEKVSWLKFCRPRKFGTDVLFVSDYHVNVNVTPVYLTALIMLCLDSWSIVSEKLYH